MAELAALITRADEQDRAQARTLAQAADDAASKDADQEVQAMREKADSDRDSAVCDGLGAIAGGAFTMGSVFAVAPTSTGGATADGKDDWHAAFIAGAAASPGIGTLASAGCKASAEQDDASAAKYSAATQADVRRYDEAHTDEQAASDSIQKVEQFLDQIQQTQNATRLAAATYRA